MKPSGFRVGTFAWFPYYAGYSPSFVEDTAKALELAPYSYVLDPWNGSGTTTTVADRLGCNAIGFDINPVATLVASAQLVRPGDALNSSGLAKEILSVSDREKCGIRCDDPLSVWLSCTLVRRYRSIEATILKLLATRAGRTIRPAEEPTPPLASFFLLCLMRAAKSLSKPRKASNPTWIRPEGPAIRRSNVLDLLFLKMIEACAQDIVGFGNGEVMRTTSSYVAIGNSCELPVEDNSIDSVITSPPYCTRLDYFRATHFELCALGIDESTADFRSLREKAMGTTLVRSDSDFEGAELLSPCVDRLLSKIRRHPSKSSSSYYYRHFYQYFFDAQQSLGEIARVLKPGGTGVFVVQDSYYKDVRIPLDKLYVDLATQTGLTATVAHSTPVRKVLSQINSRSRSYLQDRDYVESIVAVCKA